jgi:hypothetical protein
MPFLRRMTIRASVAHLSGYLPADCVCISGADLLIFHPFTADLNTGKGLGRIHVRGDVCNFDALVRSMSHVIVARGAIQIS